MPFYSASTRGFYIESVHRGNMPVDVVRITTDEHRALMAAQSAGHEIVAGTDGRPIAQSFATAPEVLFSRAIGSVKREAARRILAVASLERQTNDNAALALLPHDAPECVEAIARRASINAIRAASNVIEGQLNALAPEALAAFDAKNAAWPNA